MIVKAENLTKERWADWLYVGNIKYVWTGKLSDGEFASLEDQQLVDLRPLPNQENAAYPLPDRVISCKLYNGQEVILYVGANSVYLLGEKGQTVERL